MFYIGSINEYDTVASARIVFAKKYVLLALLWRCLGREKKLRIEGIKYLFSAQDMIRFVHRVIEEMDI